MQGGMKVYSGAPAAARCYVEADRGRADDYYLTEGTGLARRFTATDGRVTELGPLSGEAYETWVAGRDPESGQPRGGLRSDAHAVRFVEVVVNGPKTWSLAAALHPDIAAAYEAAQDRAAKQIIAWLSEHATTRVGPAGGQVQVPVQVLEAATVRHYTSRERPALAPASPVPFQGVRRREMARPAHRRHPRLPGRDQRDRARGDGH
jgi:hypothetical protein